MKLNRRSLLRGAGVAVALPWMEAMTARRARAASPIRLVTFFFPNGVRVADFYPSALGTDYAMTPALAPLAPFKNQLLIVSGVDGGGLGGAGDAHGKGVGSFATGVGPTTVGAGGPSIDQVAASMLGGATHHRSLVLAAQPSKSASSIAGISNAVYNNVSWNGRDQVQPAERDPANAFKLLFGARPGLPAADDPQARHDRSVLDRVLADIDDLKKTLGASDRTRLEAHLTAVRELERTTLTSVAAPSTCAAPAAPSATKQDARANAMIDLLAMALKCDLTRYASFMLNNGAADDGLCAGSWVGSSKAQHSATHDGLADVQARFTAFHLGFLARLLGKLADTPDGGNTLLDNTLIYAGTELGNGGTHSASNMPVLLAGRAGGNLRTGVHLRASVRRAQILYSALRLVGVPVDEFAGQREVVNDLRA